MLALASDHAGYPLKEQIKAHLIARGVEFTDFGTSSVDSVNYVDYAKKACQAVMSGQCEKALLLCGTGIGMSIAANKHKGIRAAVTSDSFSVRLTRMHNDANVLCLGQRVVGAGLACDLVDLFIDTEFEGGRHAERVCAVMAIENE